MSQLDFLHGIDVIEILDGVRPIQTAKSSIIGLVGSAGKGPVNTPVLILGNAREAVKQFGAVREDGFTLPAALDAIFKQVGATVVVVNVCDATDENRTTDVTGEVVHFAGYKGTFAHPFATGVVISGPYTAKMTAISDGSDGATFALPSGDNVTTIKDLDENTVNPDDLVVGDRYFVTYTTPSLAVNVDWVLDADNGVLSIVPDTSHLVPGTTVTVSYTYVDASKVTQADIIGGEDGQGNFTGASCLIAARSTVLVQPRILIAPGFTSTKPDAATRNPVTDALNTIAIRLRAIAVVDTANTTKESAAAYAEDWGDSERVFCHYPFYKVLKADGSGDFKDTPASPYIAGLISKVDNDKGFWWSPSNNPINGILGLSKPIDFQLNDTNTVANYLNHHSVCTTISYLGLRLWGNHMTGEATENAPGMFINVRRTADMVEESILAAHLWAVDQNITKGYVEAVVEGVNAYLRTLKAQGAILGGKAWADPTLNTPDVLAQGHLYIDFDMTPPTPAEHLSFRAHLVNDYFADIFDTTNNGAAPIT